MSSRKITRCALYVRLSKETETSVSIERQIESCTKYAEARGWEVVGVFTDEGVSADKNKPEDRKGWQALMASPKPFDAVVVWKLDRLVRKVADFVAVDQALQAIGAGIVAVEQTIDMTTAEGRAFAQMLAVFGELEVGTTRSRVMAAQKKLLADGRYIGGALPYGYRKVPHPSGKGWAIAQDEETIGVVRQIAHRTMEGHSIYSTTAWLNETGVPTATMVEAKRREADPKAAPLARVSSVWKYQTVDRLVRHPLLAGMTLAPSGKGKNNYKGRVHDTVKDETGQPVINDSLAIMSLPRWNAMQKQLDDPTNSRKRPVLQRRTYSPLLSGMLWCADPRHGEPVKMYRGTAGNTKNGTRTRYYCNECHQYISNIQDLIVSRLLDERGDLPVFERIEEIVEGGAVEFERASIRLVELGREIVTATPARAAEIVTEMTELKAAQAEAETQPTQHTITWSDTNRTIRDCFDQAQTDDERRAALDWAVRRILVHRGGTGGWTDAAKMARLEFIWQDAGQIDAPDDATLAAWADEDPARAR